jgi:hypothetical protein
VIDAKRSDSGTYTLTAKNINGVDSATVNVTVLGEKIFFIYFLTHLIYYVYLY